MNPKSHWSWAIKSKKYLELNFFFTWLGWKCFCDCSYFLCDISRMYSLSRAYQRQIHQRKTHAQIFSKFVTNVSGIFNTDLASSGILCSRYHILQAEFVLYSKHSICSGLFWHSISASSVRSKKLNEYGKSVYKRKSRRCVGGTASR